VNNDSVRGERGTLRYDFNISLKEERMNTKPLATKAIAEYKQIKVFHRLPNNFLKLTCIPDLLTARHTDLKIFSFLF
jgi:hypothetical protein